MTNRQRLKAVKMNLSSFFHLPYMYGARSYSQEGEDLYLMKMFAEKSNGFFVDVGAHHPYRYSNTYAFYGKGWRGMNIDATPGSMKAFNKVRGEDINLELAIGSETNKARYYIFEEQALNTLSKKVADAVTHSGQSKLVRIIDVEVRPLAEVLDENMPIDVPIDFLTVDAEGYDLQVLRSNDWGRFRPQVILVEEMGLATVEGALQANISKYLSRKGYQLRDKIGNSLVFFQV